tara:strand:- start:5450 stop:5800 length:351 start_codon:yes stop_codon:yes gene_type:complete
MTVKLLVLRSGEDIVADVQEMVVNEKVVGYYLDCPHRVKLISDTPKSGNTKYRSRIQILPWMPLSKDRNIPVVADWIVSMVEPIDTLKELFEDRLEQINESQSASDAEQSYLVDPD